MTAKRLIRISAILIFIHLLGHAMGHIGWDDESGPLYGVIKEMKSHSAEFMGANKSMADFYVGYSFILFGFLGMTIIMLWILSNNTSSNQKLVKQILYPIGFAYLFFGVIEFLQFFPLAAILSILAGFISILAILKLNYK